MRRQTAAQQFALDKVSIVLARFNYQGDNSSNWYYILDHDWNRGIRESQPGSESDKTNNVVSLYERGYCVPVLIVTNPARTQ